LLPFAREGATLTDHLALSSMDIRAVHPEDHRFAAGLAERSAPPDRWEPVARRLLQEVSQELSGANIPSATYRLQLHAEFDFADAAAVVRLLAKLGISHLYLSPIFRAQPGSTHGYDVVDFREVNPELGGRAGFERLVATARAHDLGVILDFVPNHMGIARGANPWWQDVLENGRSSPFASYFDIDWEPIRQELRGKVLIPTLGEHYGVVLERGELQLRFEAANGAFTLWYFETPFPIAPPTYPTVLRTALETLTDVPSDHPDLLELQSVVTALDRLPPPDETDAERLAEKQREQIVAKRRLADLVAGSPSIAAAIESAVARLNGDPGDPRSFDALDDLIERQAFRLAFWRVAAEEINYRRFFAINELAAIRQEEPAVFAATHALLLDLLGAGLVDGVRLDHPDGLWDPAGYARDLQRAHVVAGCPRRIHDRAPTENDVPIAGDAPAEPLWEEVGSTIERLLKTEPDLAPSRPLFLLVEKILEPGETLPETWPVHGTTGYEFANATTALQVDAENRRAFDELYERVAGERVRFADTVYACKYLIMRVALASEVAVLAASLDRITEQTRRFRDFTLNNLRDALREIIACFPVYRSYLICDPAEPSRIEERDRRVIEVAVREAKRRNRAIEPRSIDFVRDVLLQREWEAGSETLTEAQCRFAMKFQQLSGPVMAKGLEDTAFYRYSRLVALNEVGGDPAQFGLAPAAFHRQAAERARRWPHTLLTTATHDTKRGEDVRSRIAVLSELPRDWRAAYNRWTRLNRRHKTRLEGSPAPARDDEYLFYQTLIGVWSAHGGELGRAEHAVLVDRLVAYLQKAIREAQVRSSWVNPDEAYEAATERFVRGVLAPVGDNPFLADFVGFQRRVATAAAVNGLASQVLKLTTPGVPDLYQGTELWDLNLVDPDNRRPVDFSRRRRYLDDLLDQDGYGSASTEAVPSLLGSWEDGRIKLAITHRLLACRRRDPDLFARGDYQPLSCGGAHAERVLAFSRRLADDAGVRELVVVVPRLTAKLGRGEGDLPLGPVWGDTTVRLSSADATDYRDLLVDRRHQAITADEAVQLRLADLFARLPVAVLVSAERASGHGGKDA
jgi:(1->4)-alpha-D-glucan 1-alpha-D-glucosylmutase